MINATVWNVQGLNHRDHQKAVKDLISEFRRTLSHIVDSIDVEPWLVLGDFNVVADMSEVCGGSGDIRSVIEDFQGLLIDTGLITLPMQGALNTWHNCSDTSRSLWKRLDKMLVNDRWLDRWSSAFYISFTPRTSDHSPLIFKRNLLDNHRAKIQWLKGGDQCTRVFFQNVASRRISKRIFQITYDDGQTRTTPGEIIREFVRFYRRLLGGEPSTWFLNLLYLRPWANHIVTMEEAQRLLRPVTKEDIKLATFDIIEDKSLGSDSYSAGFYKVVWSVIVEEVTGAIMEFFSTGRLLRKLNVTLLALIPKVQSPSTFSEFQPISCCNVMYKAITKILVLRIREVLDKIISPSQNAFVTGCSIDDNILLAQELFMGYNKKHLPRRCALKVDLRKAYDTVEWDFLIAVIHLLAPGSAKRLRQGDPVSPYLFVLVIEVFLMLLQQLIDQDRDFMFHWKCLELGFFQLCFTDDLLILCEANE
ncbi:UNVERIFIED_CONTAM: hypothetical protein Sangu_1872700 [Sesamum angustifolium]|uniref:Reverse transcriptase domain-containing protein n=1 Tax=Sesamum angustifolium TaxID=2727405 RepID=A0AAW2LTM0_9LAMI